MTMMICFTEWTFFTIGNQEPLIQNDNSKNIHDNTVDPEENSAVPNNGRCVMGVLQTIL